MKIVRRTFCKDAAGYNEFASDRKSACGENRGRACRGQTRDWDHIPPARSQEYPQKIDLKINHANASSVTLYVVFEDLENDAVYVFKQFDYTYSKI